MAVRRVIIELDEDLLARAKQALGQSTTRSTVEEALRRAVEAVQPVHVDSAARQRRYFAQLSDYIDLEVLGSEQMWR